MQTLVPTWNLHATAATKWYVRLFPSLSDVAFLVPIIALFARMNGTQVLFSDGDTGWHIRTGDWILAHRAVPTVDFFSFSKPNQPWFAWEWAWDVVFAAVHQATGLAGVAFINTLILGLFVLMVYRLAFRVSQNPLISMAVTAATAGVSTLHWLARPHLVTWIFALLFLHVIASAQSGRRGLLYLLPVLMVLWTNLHGGFVAGILILGCYAMGEMLTGLFEINPESVRAAGIKAALTRSAPYWKSLALCAAATLVNPYGWQLHRHIFVYLSDSELLDKIQEFQSISFHAGMPAVLFEIMLALTAFVIFTKLRERQFAPVLLLCVWVHLALLSARHIPLFMLIAAPFVAELLTAVLAMAYHMPFVSGLARTLGGISNDFRSMELTPRLHLISAAALLALVGFFAAGQAPFAPQFNADDFPVQAIPVLQRHVGSRVFTTDQWADYLLYRMYPAQRVFFDGRSDFYGNDFVKLNQRLIAAEHDWKTLLQRFAIGLVVLKPETPLSAVLKLTPGSNVLFDDGKVIVFDTSGISQQPLGQGYIANRAVSVVPPTQPGTRPGLLPRFGHIAVSASHSNNSKKGKTS